MVAEAFLMRHTDWEQRLMDTIARHQAASFKWGRHDCATLVADAVAAVTGEDPLAAFKPWHGERTALRALQASGRASVSAWIAARFLGVEPAHAQRGDLGYVAGERHPLQFPAVIVGEHAVSRDEHAFIAFPRSLIVESYRVA